MNNIITPRRGNVLIKVKKPRAILQTKSGIFIAGAEQETNKAIIAAVPEERKFDYIRRDEYGMPVERDAEGNPIIEIGWIDWNVGDTVIIAEKFHHDYDLYKRNKIAHMTCVSDYLPDEVYDYFIINAEDILLKIHDDSDDIEIMSEFFPTEAPKTVQKAG